MADRPPPRTTQVTRVAPVTTNMLRISLGGEGLRDFPAGQKGGYVKLMLRVQDEARPVVRTYTIRDQRDGEIDIDFALHAVDGQEGPATRWALSARPGDEIAIGGPGPAKPLPEGFDRYVVAGDMTALPAIAANFENLAARAQGFAAIEIQHESDRQDLLAPEGMAIRWLVNPEPGSRPDLLEAALREHSWPRGRTYAWAACEFSAMRLLRGLLRDERNLGPEQLYLSSYWKSGLSEENHKIAKREDAMQVADRSM